MIEGDLTDQASGPRSSGSDPQTVICDTVLHSVSCVRVKVAAPPHSPTSRHNPFNEDSDTNTTNTSADVTPVHIVSRHNSITAGEDTEYTSNELEVIRYSSYRCISELTLVLVKRKNASKYCFLPGWPDEGNQLRNVEGRAPQIPAAASITPSLLTSSKSRPRRMWIWLIWMVKESWGEAEWDQRQLMRGMRMW